MTEAEKWLWRCLRSLPTQAAHFRRQATIGPYFADFACHSRKIVVEVDGGQHADSIRDHKRDAYLTACGYRVLRFWNNDVLANTQGVMTVLMQAIESPPPPTPPRRKRGEGSSKTSA